MSRARGRRREIKKTRKVAARPEAAESGEGSSKQEGPPGGRRRESTKRENRAEIRKFLPYDRNLFISALLITIIMHSAITIRRDRSKTERRKRAEKPEILGVPSQEPGIRSA